MLRRIVVGNDVSDSAGLFCQQLEPPSAQHLEPPLEQQLGTLLATFANGVDTSGLADEYWLGFPANATAAMNIFIIKSLNSGSVGESYMAGWMQ